MFEKLFTYPGTLQKHRTAPLAEQRLRYLLHLKEAGARRKTLRNHASNQLYVARLLNLKEGDKVCVSWIEAAAAIWAQPKGRQCRRLASPSARQGFVTCAIRWLRFLGWLDEVEQSRHPYSAKVTAYETWMRDERGLSETTIRFYCEAADQFFDWLAARGTALTSIRIADIDSALAAKKASGTCNRQTMHNYAQGLRVFFRFAGTRGWCTPGLAAGIMPPRYMPDNGIPKGLNRDVVVRLLASTEGNRPADKRDRAILKLFIAYGLRAGEVAGLQLDDIDWEKEMLRVRCFKPGRTHSYPLSRGVGQAILDYIREVRPSGFGRAIFFTLQAPIQPLSRRALGHIILRRLHGLGITTGKRGTHALRHAAAQHLLDQGMSMKVIGDFLGHRDPSSTAIYAKVNLGALREVANFDLGGLS